MQERTTQLNTAIDNICSKPFDFNLQEMLTYSEDTSHPANAAASNTKLYKFIKLSVLNELADYSTDHPAFVAAKNKKRFDSLEVVFRRKWQAGFRRNINAIMQNPGGLEQAMGNEYCKAIANCYDPHTAFFPLTEKENFESELGNGSYQFGFSLKSVDDGVVINELKPGSPAFKSGMLNKGDKIRTVQWSGKEVQDISNASRDEVTQILDASNHDKVTFKVEKPDGTVREVTLQKEKSTDKDDDNRVKSFILKGEKNVGYISLPAFYSDWQDRESGANGCANDVAKEILKLKKENIDGLVLDLRFNGGGSMDEAVELSGIFIDAGPVGQVKEHDAKIVTLKDVNRGTIYDGPLLVLINGFSASASEMVAGTLQDYKRAIIVGAPSYGKATSQVIMPLDTTVTNENFEALSKQSGSFIKITVGKLFRITGATAQASGVQPDIVLPDVSDAYPNREVNEDYVLRFKDVEANKYYKPYTLAMPAAATTIVPKELTTSAYYTRLAAYVKREHDQKGKDMSLRLSDALQQRAQQTTAPDDNLIVADTSYQVVNNNYDSERLKATGSNHDEPFRKLLNLDPAVRIAYRVFTTFKK